MAEALYSASLLKHLGDSIPSDYTISRRAVEGTQHAPDWGPRPSPAGPLFGPQVQVGQWQYGGVWPQGGLGIDRAAAAAGPSKKGLLGMAWHGMAC